MFEHVYTIISIIFPVILAFNDILAFWLQLSLICDNYDHVESNIDA